MAPDGLERRDPCEALKPLDRGRAPGAVDSPADRQLGRRFLRNQPGVSARALDANRTETVIHRPPEGVFEFCSDLRSELRWNPKAKYVEKLTDGPVGVGTRYRARWSNSGPTAVEVIRFDRPPPVGDQRQGQGMAIRFQGTVTDATPGARYAASLELHPKGLARLVAPFALLTMRRQDQQHMHRIREALESSTVTSDGARTNTAR